jgi:hypothetical protein
MVLLSSLVLFAVALEAPVRPLTYRCLDDTMFTLSASPTLAIVRFANAEYRLPRRQSGLAIKYASKTATLYLDKDFAAFIADDRPLPGCYRVKAGESG